MLVSRAAKDQGVGGGGGGKPEGGVPPSDLHAVGLGQADGEQEGHPEDGSLLLDLLEVTNGRACNADD